MADGITVAVVPFQYGEGIESLPEIPTKKGYSAAWPDLDYTHLNASQTLEAEYTPYTSALSDGGELPEILVDGSFSSRAEVSHTIENVTWSDRQGKTHTGHCLYRHSGRPGFRAGVLYGSLPPAGLWKTLCAMGTGGKRLVRSGF